MASNNSWKKIFDDYSILSHDFNVSPFYLTSQQIKSSVQSFTRTSEKEVRILCKIDSRRNLPQIMVENGLILLPVRNGRYAIIRGEGYIDIPDILGPAEEYNSKLGFELETARIGNSEMQHLDFAYASSLIRTFMDDPTLVLTIRGRKFTPPFIFTISGQQIESESVQTEVDAGYEGKDSIVLVEAKNSKTKNTIIRQLYYPYRQWSEHTNKKIYLLFFEKRFDEYLIWQYDFTDINSYDSIRLVRHKKYKII